MGAFVGALFERNTNKTNNKQHVNRGYDSESGTKFIRPRCKAGLFSFLATVDFRSLQHVICLLYFSSFSPMFVTFRHPNIL